MSRAKQRGGGLYELFDETVRAQLIERLELERALRQAVEADELRALYQPIVPLKEGRWSGSRPWSAGTTRVGAGCCRPSSCPSPRRPA
jgi:predicted signal transduction protein with EAL and GGDEF domain